MALTQAQVEERVNYCGGSDAAAILGLSPWKTVLSVWAEKTGQVPAEDISGKLQVKLGTKMEGIVADLYIEKTGRTLHRKNETMYHSKYPFLAANIDRRIVGMRAGFEAKTTAAWSADKWADGKTPVEYEVQCLHYLMVTGWDFWDLAVIIGNQDVQYRTFTRDEAILKSMEEKLVHFWKTFVEPKVMPGIITRNDGDVLFKLFPHGQDEEVALEDEADALAESIEGMNADYKNLEGQIDKAKNELKAMLKDNAAGRTPGGRLVTWKDESKKRIDMDKLKTEQADIYAQYAVEAKSRVLRIKKAKGGK